MSKQKHNKSLRIDNNSNLLNSLTENDINECMDRMKEISNMTDEQKKILLDREGDQDVQD